LSNWQSIQTIRTSISQCYLFTFLL
jgi:hypothetical protein